MGLEISLDLQLSCEIQLETTYCNFSNYLIIEFDAETPKEIRLFTKSLDFLILHELAHPLAEGCDDHDISFYNGRVFIPGFGSTDAYGLFDSKQILDNSFEVGIDKLAILAGERVGGNLRDLYFSHLSLSRRIYNNMVTKKNCSENLILVARVMAELEENGYEGYKGLRQKFERFVKKKTDFNQFKQLVEAYKNIYQQTKLLDEKSIRFSTMKGYVKRLFGDI